MTFDYLPPSQAFLDPDRADSRHPESARAVVIPFGLETSVSYGGGTAKGPDAILEASHQLELYDEELQREAVNDYGIATLRPEPIATGQEAALRQLAGIVERVLDADRFPFVIGGEHALTPGAIMPLAAAYHDLVVLQFDAHADLRDGYLGEHYSHASAMRRVLDHAHVRVVSVGIRALSSPEADFARQHSDRVAIHWAKDQARWNIDEIVAPLAGKPVYITYDIDALDAAIMPATGTPTPGGMNYLQSLEILRRACQVAGRVVGADLVELAPQTGLHACDYTAAVLAYKMMSYALAGTGPRS